MPDGNPTSLLSQINIYSELVTVAHFEPNTGSRTLFAASPESVVAALLDTEISTGIIPPAPYQLVYFARQGKTEKLAVLVPPMVHQFEIEGEMGPAVLNVPMPSLIFVGVRNTYRIGAMVDFTGSGRDEVYQTPAPNTASNNICWGSGSPPPCKTSTIGAALQMYLGSRFTNHSSSSVQSGDCLALWRKLSREQIEVFPHEELKRAGTLAQFLGSVNF